MIAVLAGVASFLVAFTFDIFAIKSVRGVKPMVVFLVVALHAYAIYAACWGVSRFEVPGYVSLLGWATLPIWGLLLLYSLVLELPPGQTYARPGVGDRLVTTGTYALTRHPGVIWYILALGSLLLACHSRVLLVAVPIWAALDVLHVTVQDKFFFSRMFPEYKEYQKKTPMLIPTLGSISACIRTVRARRRCERKSPGP